MPQDRREWCHCGDKCKQPTSKIVTLFCLNEILLKEFIATKEKKSFNVFLPPYVTEMEVSLNEVSFLQSQSRKRCFLNGNYPGKRWNGALSTIERSYPEMSHSDKSHYVFGAKNHQNDSFSPRTNGKFVKTGEKIPIATFFLFISQRITRGDTFLRIFLQKEYWMTKFSNGVFFYKQITFFQL